MPLPIGNSYGIDGYVTAAGLERFVGSMPPRPRVLRLGRWRLSLWRAA